MRASTSWVQRSSAPAASRIPRAKIYDSSFTVAPDSNAPLKCFRTHGLERPLIDQGKTKELVGFLVDGTFLQVQIVHLIEKISKLREKFRQHTHYYFRLIVRHLSSVNSVFDHDL